MPWDVLCDSADRERTCRVSCLRYRESGIECQSISKSPTPIYDALRAETRLHCPQRVGPTPKLGGHTCRCNKLTPHQLPHTCDCGSWFEPPRTPGDLLLTEADWRVRLAGDRWRRHCCATWSDQPHAELCDNYGGRNHGHVLALVGLAERLDLYVKTGPRPDLSEACQRAAQPYAPRVDLTGLRAAHAALHEPYLWGDGLGGCGHPDCLPGGER